MKYKIYRLEYKGEIIYIGQTTKTLKERKRSGYKFIPKDILKECDMIIIEETDDIKRERFYIEEYKNKGCNLYNIEKGAGYNLVEYNKDYYEDNKNDILKRKKNNYDKDYYIDYHNRNKEEILEKKKNYYIENRDEINRKARERYKNKILQKNRIVMEYKIYRLEYKGEIIYIGQTKQELKKRMCGKHPSIPEDIRKECEIFLQENTDDKNREFYWIDYYIEQGCNLYNKRGGKYNKKSEDSMREYRKKYQIETKYYKNYYIINKEKISDWHKEHYEKNKERILEYREKNKDKKREYDRKRREQKNQLLK